MELKNNIPVYSFKGHNKVMNYLMEDLNIDERTAEDIISYTITEFMRYDKNAWQYKGDNVKAFKPKMRIWSRLFQRIFKKISPDKKRHNAYTIILDSLVRSGLIDFKQRFSKARRQSRLYELVPRTLMVVDHRPNQFQEQYNYEYEYGSMSEDLQKTAYISDKLKETLERIEIDITPREREQKKIVDDINKNIIKNMSTYRGRVFDQLKNLKSEYRQHIKIDGERTEEVDIPSSQPKFLAMLLEREVLPIERNNNTQAFIDICRKGDIYEHIRDIFDDIIEFRGHQYVKMLDTRDKAKDFFYFVFFGQIKNSDYNRYSRKDIWKWCATRLRDIYPQVFSVVDDIKKYDHRSLSQVLTLDESDFCYEVTYYLNEVLKTPVYNVHDSFIVKEGYGKVVEEMIYDHFSIGEYFNNPDVNNLKRYVNKKREEDIEALNINMRANDIKEEVEDQWVESDLQDQWEMEQYYEQMND